MENKDDAINPDHYKNQCSIECIESMVIVFGVEAVYNFCICNTYKYLWRYKNKNGNEDLIKAKWYVDKARELLESLDDTNYNDEEKLFQLNKLVCDKIGSFNEVPE